MPVSEDAQTRISTVVAIAAADAGDVAAALEALEHFDVVGLGPTVDEAADAVVEHQPDVLIIDSVLQGTSTLDRLVDMKASSPRTAVIVCTTERGTGIREASVTAGARAVIGNDDPFEWLVKTVYRAVPDKAPSSAEEPARSVAEMPSVDALLVESRGNTYSWWRDAAVRPWLIVGVIAALPLSIAAVWVVAQLYGSLR